MFLSCFPPFIHRYWKHPDYYWVLLKQVQTLGPKHLSILADADYFKDYRLWHKRFRVCGLEFKSTSKNTFKKTPHRTLNTASLGDWADLPPADILKKLVSQPHAAFSNEFKTGISQAAAEQPLKAILSWSNLPCLRIAADHCGLPVIHNEVGPLRAPVYRQTIYFDLSGVNAGTSAERDARQFYEHFILTKKTRLLSLEELQTIFYTPRHSPSGPPRFAVGVPLQVATDSNVMAFNRDWTFEKILRKVREENPGQAILVRPHPEDKKPVLDSPFVLDTSESAREFLLQCEKIYTLNSSVAFECLLWDKPVVILGESPADFLSWEKKKVMTTQEYLAYLNYLFLGYLVPAAYLFDRDYYAWRLDNPTLEAIRQKHLAYWQNTPKPRMLTRMLKRGFLRTIKRFFFDQSC